MTWYLSGTEERHIPWYIKFWMIMGKNIQLLKPLPRRKKQKNEKRKSSISSLSEKVRDFWKYVEEREMEEQIISGKNHKDVKSIIYRWCVVK